MDSNQRRRNSAESKSQVGSGNASGIAAKQLRKPRHAGLFEAVHRLDMALDERTRAELASWIKEQYSVEYGDVPMGFVAVCYLGPPYVDHRLDLIFSIVDHYGPSDLMPEPFAQARMMARSGAYEFVEVYSNGQLVPVHSDGSVVTS